MGTVLSCSAVVLLAIAAWRDLGTRMIPDALPAALLASGLALRLYQGGAGVSLLLAALLFAALALLHARGWLGGGDVKLAAGVAAGLAPPAVLLFLVVTGIAGGVLAAAHLVLRGLTFRPRRLVKLAGPRRVWPPSAGASGNGSLPYGIAIACGGAWVTLTGLGG